MTFSTILNSFYNWDAASNCHLDKLEKLKKPIGRLVGPIAATSLEPLGHLQNASV